MKACREVSLRRLCELPHRVHVVKRRVLDLLQNREDGLADVFVLCAEEVDRRRVCGKRVVHVVQGADDLEERLPRRLSACREAGEHLVRVKPEKPVCLCGCVGKVFASDVELFDRVADLVHRKDAFVSRTDKVLHKLFRRKPESGVLRRVFVQYVEHIAVLVRAVLRAVGDDVVRLFRR